MKPTLHTTDHTIIKRNSLTGMGLALLAVFVWSGNFIVAREMKGHIPPISLSFYRWSTASIIIFSFAFKKIKAEWNFIKQSLPYLILVSIAGVALFNTFTYVGAQYTTAINLALIGTTSSPVMAVILARIFLHEHIGSRKIMGMILCITGVLLILSKGHIQNMLSFHFGKGDLWMLAAAFCFASYNTLVKKRPASISTSSFLAVTFLIGCILLFPFYLMEKSRTATIQWSPYLFSSILYLGLGASVIGFTIWNIAIHKIGTGRTALFGNLIPIFTSIEAVLYLHESFTIYHVISMLLVFAGLLLANTRSAW